MRYSTQPQRDLLRAFVVTITIGMVLYVAWGAWPFGIEPFSGTRGAARLGVGDREVILDYLRAEGAIHEEADRWDIYRETFWRPWIRFDRGSAVTIEEEGAGLRVSAVKGSENGIVQRIYFARKEGGGWEFTLLETPIVRY